jgi:uncharacterized membrane protein
MRGAQGPKGGVMLLLLLLLLCIGTHIYFWHRLLSSSHVLKELKLKGSKTA